MRLHVRRLGRVDSSSPVQAIDQLDLSLPTGKRDARRLTILVCSGVADHGTYGIARLERFVEALEHETGDALSSAKSIAALIIGITAPIGREESAIVSVPCGG
jgi:hypothetical protein